MVRSIAALLVAAIALLAGAPVLAQDAATEAMTTTVDIGSHKHLNNAIGLVNKNNVIHSNNMAMAKSNLRLRQDDDVTLDLEAQNADEAAVVAVGVGSHKHLNNAIGLVNKNRVIHSNNIALAKSNLLVRQDDDVTLELPEGLTLTQETQPLADAQEQFPMNFRQRFTFNRGGRVFNGWRYPIGYWNRFGRSRFARDCVFNRPFGGFFYC